MSGKEFTGHVRAMRADNDWFGAEDFCGSDDIPLKIVRVEYDANLRVGGAASKDKFYLVLANADGKECKKRMIINSGRRQMLTMLYGGVSGEWKGKWVWVYVDKVKSVKGGQTLGMKFRDRTDAPQVKQSPPQQDQTNA